MAKAIDFLLPEWMLQRAGGLDCVLPDLYVEVIIPKVIRCRGQAFGQKLGLDEVMRLGSS